MKKTFLDWVKNPKKQTRNFRGSKACYLCDLNGKVLFEFDNLMDCARHLKKKRQISDKQYNTGTVISKKYRVFTINYYLENKEDILKLKNHTVEHILKSKMHKKQNIILCDLYPEEEFLYTTNLSKKLKKTPQTIGLILNGGIKKNPYNIRYKYPELRNLDFRQYPNRK